MKSSFIFVVVLLLGLSLHAAPLSRPMIVGVSTAVVSVIAIGVTSFSVKTEEVFWKIVPWFIGTASAGILIALGSLCVSGQEPALEPLVDIVHESVSERSYKSSLDI